jgi:hypothetical protein
LRGRVQDSARDGILCDARRSPHLHRNGLQVAAANGGKAEIRKMRVTRDSGTEVKVDTRVKAGDQVIFNPPITLVDGSKVQL